MEKLVEVSDHEILIDFSLGCKCRTNIHLKSLSPTATIAFKLQTSSPNKFLVNPPTGLLRPLSSTTFQIVLKPQSHLPPTFPRSPSDRFLLKTTVADLDGDCSDVSLWFNSSTHRPTYDIKLKVYFVGPFLLTHAVATGNLDSVKGIIKRQRSLVSQLPAKEAELIYNAAADQPDPGDILSVLLEAGLRVIDGSDLRWAEMGWSELHVAAAFDRVDDVERLVSGGKVESKDREGRTPLHLAAINGHLGCAKVLVNAGADVDARSKDGRTALCRAAANGDRTMVAMLVEADADPTVGDVGNCRSAIDEARDKDHKEVVKILERGEAVINAARRGEVNLLESLLQKGASIKYNDQYGLTALHVAALKGNKDVVMMLIEFGAHVECQDVKGFTPLHLAVQGGSIETVEVLINRGADRYAKSNKGATPVYIAKLMECEDILQILIDKEEATTTTLLVPSIKNSPLSCK